MIDYSLLNLEGLALHAVGNKHHEETNYISDQLLELEEDTRTLLLDYFLTPFVNYSEVYQFQKEEEDNITTLHQLCDTIFNQPDQLLETSVKILEHLYEQSEHPHIKVGEVFVAYMTELVFDDVVTDAIGIFKAERKDEFFQFKKDDTSMKLRTAEGINPGKLDKGCVIVNTESEDGYRVLTVDTNRYDAEYWKREFLNIDFAQDHNLQTKNYVDFCKDFSKKIIKENEGKKEEITFLKQSVNYLEENPNLDFAEFTDTLFDDDVRKEQFRTHKKEYQESKDVDFPDDFKISIPVLNSQKKKIKSQINLDTNIQIKLNFENPDSAKQFVERGYDAEKNMHFYKVFFNKETN